MSLPEKRFRKRVESFTCFSCGTRVEGTGYTDHCPECLGSIHMDINPGDRDSACRGKMEPISFNPRENMIYYRCGKCGKTSRVRTSENDNKDMLLELSSLPQPALEKQDHRPAQSLPRS
jgi:predicted RNA-binding Zn-ribbon protein involved in translation (DUF1610 family)